MDVDQFSFEEEMQPFSLQIATAITTHDFQTVEKNPKLVDLNQATDIGRNDFQNMEENPNLFILDEQCQMYGDFLNNGNNNESLLNTQNTCNFATSSTTPENSYAFQGKQHLFENNRYNTGTNVEFSQHTLDFNIPLDLSKSNSPQMSNFQTPTCSNEYEKIVYQNSNFTGSENQCSLQTGTLRVENSQNETKSADYNKVVDVSRNQIVDTIENKTPSQNSLHRKKFPTDHPPLPSCDNCKLQCSTKIGCAMRKKINEEYWLLKSWEERRMFFTTHVIPNAVKRRTLESQCKRNKTYIYYLPNEDNIATAVCKAFFLTTLGFKLNNDKALTRALKDKNPVTLKPQPEKRGTTKEDNTLEMRRICIREHVESYHPSISHYRREHAPNRRYLPSEITIKQMHTDFIEKYPTYLSCSYEIYRNEVKDMNISFTKLGNEECEQCEVFEMHHPDHNKNNLSPDCDSCNTWVLHKKMANEARALYQSHVEKSKSVDLDAAIYSGDLQKVIMFPKMDSFKTAIFTRRAILFNQSFVPLQSTKGQNKPFAVIWNESIAGRKKEELTSAFYHFFLFRRDKKHIIIWLDNCSAQNKNWCLLTFFIYIINSNKIATTNIEIYYFEKGHTFMSADSFHHQVEESIKRQKNIYDYMDFEEVIKQSNSNVSIKSMQPTDFCDWKDFSSAAKLKKMSPRPNLNDIKILRATKGAFYLEYKLTYNDEEEFKKLDFLQAKIAKSKIPNPEPRTSPRGICRTKKAEIIAKLVPLMPVTRHDYWMDIPENDVEDLISHEE